MNDWLFTLWAISILAVIFFGPLVTLVLIISFLVQ